VRPVEFLKAFHPEGPWVLTAINVDRKGIETVTFGPDTEDAAANWIDGYNGKRNLYFSVNVPVGNVTKKTKTSDIRSVPWLHVDVDARVGEPLKDELKRIRKLLTQECPVLSPTFIVFSGGGYQAFWKLTEAIPVENEQDAQRIAAYNKQLEVVFEGDNCSNIDRIMRLPGTTNIPNAKKVEKGRTAAEAKVEVYNPDNIYDLSQFTPAPGLQSPGLGSGVGTLSTSNIDRIMVDELDKWSVPDRVKVIIVQGFDPDNPKDGDNSRSAWLFDVVCQLVRCNVPDEVIYSVITDPDFGISSSVLDKEASFEKYAMKQINSAKEEVEEPWLRRLNDEFFIVGDMGGKTRVLSEIPDIIPGRYRLSKQTFGDFRNRFLNQTILVGKRTMCVADWWFKHPHRRQFDRLIFDPKNRDPNCYNLWQGFGCRAIPGGNHESFLQHIRMVLCAGDELHYQYFLGWMARAVQKPGSQGEAAIVLRGKSGTGKSFFAKNFGSLWGRHYLQVSDAKHLVGAFNAHLRDCIVLFGDEAFYAGDKKHESVLKTLITENQMVIEAKGVDAEVYPNFIHMILASNSEWVVPTGPTERRFFVLDVADDHQQESAYFAKVQADMDEGGRESLLYYLLNYDLTGFDVRKVPVTAALLEQKKYSLSPMHDWWLWRLEQGTLLDTHDYWEGKVPVNDLIDDYVASLRDFHVNQRGSRIKVGMFLKNVCPDGWPKKTRESSGANRPYYYEFPPLRHCREKWDKLFGGGEHMEWQPESAATSDTDAPF